MDNTNILKNIESIHAIQINEVNNKQNSKVKRREANQGWYQKNKMKILEYIQRPEVKVKKQEYDQKWYQNNITKRQSYDQRPEVKARKRECSRRWYQKNKAKIQQQKAKEDDYHFDAKQNFELNTETLLINSEFSLPFADDGRYDEQTIKTAWNILEP